MSRPFTSTTGQPHATSDLVTLPIEKLVYGGSGLSRLPDGRVVFVDGVIPGEEARCHIIPHSKQRLVGQVVQITQPSAHRTPPRCNIIEACGGCQWQHLDVETQGQWKHAIVTESLTRLGKIVDPPVQPCQQAQAWAYRTSVRWQVNRDAQLGQVSLGYYGPESDQVVPFETCPILAEPLQQVAGFLTGPASSLLVGAQQVLARCNEAGDVLVGLIGPKAPTDLENLNAVLTDSPLVGILHAPELTGPFETLWGQPALTVTMGPWTFKASIGHFFQAHLQATQALLTQLKTSVSPGQTLLDLYSGCGLFTVALGDQFKTLWAVESDEVSVQLAAKNAEQLEDVTLVQQPVEDFVQSNDDMFDTILLDPPRNGVPESVINWIGEHARAQVVYVSCNPTTLARDLKALVAQGWQLKTVVPFDFFPQTYHVESMAILEKKSPVSS